MRSAACLVGNSSASIREGAFIGTPAVNIGSRQDGRERGPNVIDVGHDRTAIADAIRRQVEHGPYPPAHLYGDGKAGRAHRGRAGARAAARPEADSGPERPRCHSGARRIKGIPRKNLALARGSAAARLHGRRRAGEQAAVARGGQHRGRGDRRRRAAAGRRGAVPAAGASRRRRDADARCPDRPRRLARADASDTGPTSSCCCSRRRRSGAPSHIDAAVDLLTSTGADSVVTVVPVPHQFTPSSLMQLAGRPALVAMATERRPCDHATAGQAAPVCAQRSGRRRGAHSRRDGRGTRCTDPTRAAS